MLKSKERIDTVEECEEFISSYSTYPKMIRLNVPPLSQGDNLKYSAQINKYRNACGCDTGTVFLTISLVVSIIGFASDFSFLDFSLPHKILFYVVFIFISLIIGKIIGLLNAKIKLLKLLKNLKKNIEQQSISET